MSKILVFGGAGYVGGGITDRWDMLVITIGPI